MKKSLLIFACVLCVLLLFACNNTPEQTTEKPTTETTSEPSSKTTNPPVTETTENQTFETTEAPIGETTEKATTEVETTEEETTEEETTEEETTEVETTEVDDESARVVLKASKTELKSGEEFSVTVYIKNNPGIYSFTFKLPIDNGVFEFVSASTKESLCSSFGICSYDESALSYKFNGYSSSAFKNITDDGEIVTITLKVKDSASAGKYTLKLNPDHKNIINVNSQLVVFEGAELVINILN